MVVTRDGAGIYLSQGGQGHPGTWAWIGVEDVGQLYQEYQTSGAKLRGAPRNNRGRTSSRWRTRTATSFALAQSRGPIYPSRRSRSR